MAFPIDKFRKVLGSFATGVTIITLKCKDEIHGLTVNAFTSVSLEPPIILICIQKKGNSHACFSAYNRFVVNILSMEQEELAIRFADSDLLGPDRFNNLSFQSTEQGIPILDGTSGYLECRIVNEFDGGDHTIFFGELENAEEIEGKSPLLFYKSKFFHL